MSYGGHPKTDWLYLYSQRVALEFVAGMEDAQRGLQVVLGEEDGGGDHQECGIGRVEAARGNIRIQRRHEVRRRRRRLKRMRKILLIYHNALLVRASSSDGKFFWKSKPSHVNTGLGICSRTWVGLNLIRDVPPSFSPAQPLLPISHQPRQN